MSTETYIKTNKIIALLYIWLERRTSAEGLALLNCQKLVISQNGKERILFMALSRVCNYLGKQKLELSTEELQAAKVLVRGWNPINWTLDQVGRTLLILSFPHKDRDRYIATLEKILAAADIGESIALYQSLPLLPHPENFKLLAAEGIRSNMTSVFNAVALHNPYPAEYLDDLAWNQMVLKALFVGSPLHPIYGLERRNNKQLSQMLIDYARERLAAKRTVNPEVWQLVAPFNSQAVADLEPAFKAVSN